MKIAIMQPTYLSWVGYYAMMSEVDIFVLLDNVQFSKRSWQQRNKIKTKLGEKWLTVPVSSKGKRDQKIFETKINTEANFNVSHTNQIRDSYKGLTGFERYSPIIFDIINSDYTYLAALNEALIRTIANLLLIDTKIILASDLDSKGDKDQLLSSICQELNATHYLSSPGSKNYMDESTCFSEASIAVEYFDYVHPVYSQINGTFTPYMSVLDLLFNEDENSVSILKKL